MNRSSTSRNLITGLLLVAIGTLFLLVNLGELRINWPLVVKLVLPAAFLALGLVRLVRHFSWDEDRLQKEISRASLLAGLFWSFLGILLLLDTLGLLETIQFFGRYWPVLLILYGLGKVLDFYRLNVHLPVQATEIFGLVFIATFGFFCSRLSDAHFPLIDLPALADFPAALVEQPAFEFVSEETVDIAETGTLEVTNLYGEVHIEASQADHIQVRLTRIVRSDSRERAREIADSVKIVQERKDAVLRLRTNRQDLGEKGSRLNTHLSFQVPASLSVRVSNRYGDVSLQGLEGGGFVSNAYGGIRVENSIGNFELENRYEDVVARNVTGNLSVVNERGSITVNALSGKVDLRTRYARIKAQQIGGDFLGMNHFGSIDLEDVKGTVSIQAPGSQIRAKGLQDNVTIRTSHKPVHVSELVGALNLETAYNEIRLDSVGGKVDVSGEHCRLIARNLTGGLGFEGKGSRLTLTDVQNGIRIRTSLQEVRIQDFTGPVTVSNEFAPINVISGEPPRDSVELQNRNGPVRLTLPSDSDFRLTAEAEGGRIRSDFGTGSETGQRVEHVMGEGGPLVTIRTRFANIELKKRG